MKSLIFRKRRIDKIKSNCSQIYCYCKAAIEAAGGEL
jgi:hypothetical protein